MRGLYKNLYAPTNAQYTPPTPTRRNCRVESRRRCVHNYSQLVGDSFDESEQICKQRIQLRRVGGVNASVGSRRELVADCIHTADAEATQLDSCVASAVCIGHYGGQTPPYIHPRAIYVSLHVHARVRVFVTDNRYWRDDQYQTDFLELSS